jgi:hypothetical protein
VRYLDTRILEKLDLCRHRAARPRRYIWLLWMQPHFRPHAGKLGLRVNVKWPVYARHGGA